MRRELGERADPLRKRGSETRYAHLAECFGENIRDDQAVFERIADARRRLRALRQHGPFALAIAGKIDRDELQILAVGRQITLYRAQISGMPEHERGRYKSVAQ